MSQLVDAVRAGELETVKQLLAKGESPNSRESDSATAATALMRAAEKGHTEIVKLLLEKGADVNATWNVGGTALAMIAGNQKSTAIMKLLIENGADVNNKDDYGQTALTSAAVYDRAENVRLLLDSGATINARKVDGSTALSEAVKYSCVESIHILLDNGAEVDDRLLGLARKPEVVAMLMSAARNPRTVPEKNQPPKTDGRINEHQEPWQKYKCYVQVPKDVPDIERRPNMRFQFLFSSPAEADQILSSLPSNLRSALPRPQMAMYAPSNAAPDVAGKYQVWFERVSLTIGEGKDLMNRVVKAGGGIYEAFLT